MNIRILGIAAITLAGLTGCTMFGGSSETAPVRMRDALELPPDLTRTAGDDLSSLPATSAAASTSASAAKGTAAATSPSATATPTLVAIPANARARLEREGSQRWLVVQATPDQVWTLLRDYLQRNQGPLAVEDAKRGYIETDWLEQRPNVGKTGLTKFFASMHSTGLRDKFRVRIEPGRAAGTTEVMVSHIGLEEIVVSSGPINTNTAWQPRASDPVLEAELLDRLMAALGVSDPTTRPPLKAEGVQRGARPKGPLVLSGEGIESAWRRVSQALDRSGAVIEDRDRAAGLLYVRYRDPQADAKSGGFLSGLFGGNDKKSTEAEGGQDRYQLRLKAVDAGVRIEVLDVKGEPDTSKPAEHLLDLLFQQLL